MKHNIVIKGVELTGDLKLWAYNFLLDRIKVRVQDSRSKNKRKGDSS